MSQKVNLNAYFERIGFAGSIAPTLATLELIQTLHTATIPFENLDPVMGRPVRLDQSSLEQKMLYDGRGGYCFEQNVLFRNILRELDYTVRSYAARVLFGMPEGGARMISHMFLVVDIAGTSYLCDVGFGSFTLTAPLKLRVDTEQRIGDDAFRLLKDGELYALEVKLGDDWRGVYQFELTELDDAALAALNSFVEGEYHSRALLYAARADKDGRTSLSGNRLSIYRPGAEGERRVAASVDELKAMLSDVFRIALPPAEELDPALKRVIDAAGASAA